MSNPQKYYTLEAGNVHAIPVFHYTMEFAAHVRKVFQELKPDCIAVELAETLQLQLLHAASRLPDISLVITENSSQAPIYYLSEPCDAAFEALRCALENQLPAFCIDLDVDFYPEMREFAPDPYAIQRIGLENYYKAYQENQKKGMYTLTPLDEARELYMAKRLKELSLSYDRILFIGGMTHVANILKYMNKSSFPTLQHAKRNSIQLYTLTEESCRNVMGEFGWMASQYEEWRQANLENTFLDRQKLILQLYKKSSELYITHTGNAFPGYNLRNIMKFARNYALVTARLMPDLYQILSAAKGCVDSNYAYEVWALSTDYPYRKNIDNLPELNLSLEDMWGHSKLIRFQLRQPSRKNSYFERKKKDRASYQFKPPGLFSICSYPPEDIIIEKFGDFLKKKGTQILMEESSRTIPFSTSIEEGIDTRETIRHWHEKKIYIKTKGKPPGGVGSIVIIFDEDSSEDPAYIEKFPWCTTWLGEHNQESDMAFYATPLNDNVVGPGISRCEYGGFLMSYPPRRMLNIWDDPDYIECRNKAEMLLMAAIDYSVKPLITYVAAKPPRSNLKSFARRFGKKIVYFPIGQLSPITINKIRAFHVLDGHDKRTIADEYIN